MPAGGARAAPIPLAAPWPPAVAAAAAIGIGLRQPHYAAVFEGRPALDFVEVHSENFFADGGAALAVLRQAREAYPVSLHGVGLALGSAAGLDPWHLDRLARLVERIEPVRVSDHACFGRAALAPGAPVLHANDLLPIAFGDESLAIMVRNVEQVQERLGRQLLVENLSSYLSFANATMGEAEFLARLCARSGCGLLLDVNNLMVNALNAPSADTPDPLAACRRFIDALPLGIVGEIHLAGYCVVGEGNEVDAEAGPRDGSGSEVGTAANPAGSAGADLASFVIDDHGSRVRPAVWAVYEHALRRFGAVPSLVEWDTDLPAFEVLLGEARHAGRIAARAAA